MGAFWKYLWTKLREERGDAGDLGELNEDDAMFNDEEREILGLNDDDDSEFDLEDDTRGDDDPPVDDDEDAPPKDDEEPEDSTQKRINELTARSKTAEEKLELLRTDPAKYREQYPDEFKEKPEPQPQATTSFKQAENLVFQEGPYKGKTLGEVNKTDPVYAMDAYLDYRDQKKAVIKAQQEADEKFRQETQQELDDFGDSLASRLFEKESVNELDDKQQEEVSNIVANILEWLDETGRIGYKMEDAYYILNRENFENDAKGKAISALIKQATKGQETPHVEPKKGSHGTKTGYGAVEAMTRAEMAAYIEKLPEKKYAEFIKNAPESLKQKHPDIDWE